MTGPGFRRRNNEQKKERLLKVARSMPEPFPDVLAKRFGLHSSTVREWLKEAKITWPEGKKDAPI